jgi:hypothetical protein
MQLTTSLLAKSTAVQRAMLEQAIAALGFSRPGAIPEWMGFRTWGLPHVWGSDG